MAGMTPKEKPILFSGQMVRAILEDRKTMTRRVQQLTAKTVLTPAQRTIGFEFNAELARYDYPVTNVPRLCVPMRHPNDKAMAWEACGCSIIYARYTVGDRLWVKETFYVQPDLWQRSHGLQPVDYCATTPPSQVEDYVTKPSILMPRWASRITLEVTGVKVERVQDITVQDALAEGICVDNNQLRETPNFRELWDSINGKREGCSWADNPWVWAVTFRVIK